MSDASSGSAERPSSPGLTAEVLHSTGASLHTPESFGRAVVSAALMAMAQPGEGALDDRTLPATFSIKTLRTSTDSQPLCVDVCVGVFGAEICIHVVIPPEIVAIF